jgi:hypothetical protein
MFHKSLIINYLRLVGWFRMIKKVISFSQIITSPVELIGLGPVHFGIFLPLQWLFQFQPRSLQSRSFVGHVYQRTVIWTFGRTLR